MPAHRRAILYVTRKAGRSLLLLIALVLVMSLILVAMGINRAAEAGTARLRESLGGYFKIALDYRKMQLERRVDQALIDRVLRVDGVRAVNAMDTAYLSLEDLALEPGRFTGSGEALARVARILANTDTSLHEFFALNILRLTEGRRVGPDDVGKGLISDRLARANGLGVGSVLTATVTQEVASGSGAVGASVAVEVVGLFEELHTTVGDETTPESDLPANFVFVDSATGAEIGRLLGGEPEQRYFNAGVVFYVQDPQHLDTIVAQVGQMEELDGDSLTLTANNAAYRGSVEPLTRLGALTTLAAWCVALFAVALLSLLLTLWERDRIHEVGALLSFGIPKKSILAQHLIEAAVVFVAAFLVSVAVALPATTRLGHLLHDTSAARATEAGIVAEVPATDPAGLDPQIAGPGFDVRLGPDGIVAAGAAGAAIVGLSVGAAFLVVARRSPKDLLTVLE